MTKPDRIAKGVRVRTYPSGLRRIEVQFRFREETCKEVLPHLDGDSPSARKYARNLKSAIEHAKLTQTFVYSNFFPDSPRAAMFGPGGSRITVKEAQASLIRDLELAGLEKTTLASYRKSAARIDACLGKKRVAQLSPEDIRSMVRERRVSRKTWNNDLIPLRRALNRAVNDNVILFSPLDRVQLDDLVPRHKRPVPDPFSMSEIEAILNTAQGYCERAWNLYVFAFFTGMRLEEIAGLDITLHDESGYSL